MWTRLAGAGGPNGEFGDDDDGLCFVSVCGRDFRDLVVGEDKVPFFSFFLLSGRKFAHLDCLVAHLPERTDAVRTGRTFQLLFLVSFMGTLRSAW